MASILFLIDTIHRNIFRCNCLRNKIHFRNFFWQLENLDWILENFKKEITLIADVLLNLATPKTVVR